MPIRDRIIWRDSQTFSDPRLSNLPELIQQFCRGQGPDHWSKAKEFENRANDLPIQPEKYYMRYHVGDSGTTGQLRIVIGGKGEVFITGMKQPGNDPWKWRQILGLPDVPQPWWWDPLKTNAG